MEQNEETRGNAAFGAYLKKVREGRRLSLDAVEELSAGFPEKVTKSHLSRIENGLALPTFPRLMAMGHIYGVPIASLAERYELELRRGMAPVDLGGKSDEEVLRDVDATLRSGEIHQAIALAWALFERRGEGGFGAALVDERSFVLRVRIISCLTLAGRYEYAKSLVEDFLSVAGVSESQRLVLMQLLATTSYRLRKYTVARLAIEECERGSRRDDVSSKYRADILALKANIVTTIQGPESALPYYREAAEAYARDGAVYDAASARINLAEALGDSGQLEEAQTVLASVLHDLEPTSFDRLRALTMGAWTKVAYLRGNLDESSQMAVKSNLIARQLEHAPLVFKNCFYLWRIAQAKQDSAAVRLNERTLRSYLGRIEGGDSEVEEFRGVVTREET